MTSGQFERETRYQAMVAISKTMLNKGIISADDFHRIEGYLQEKYRPIFYAA